MPQYSLELKNIVKKFGNVTALNNINLAVEVGELVSLIGPSGSGKTTLLQIAGLLDKYDSGAICINGIEVSNVVEKNKTEIRKKNIGFIYQFHHLLPEFSAIENVAMPLLIQGFDKKYSLQEASKILHEVDLADRLNHKPAELSGGQQQRVAIARAIVSKPSIILADEPTGNLDSANSIKIFDLLQTLSKVHQIACLLVTHNIDLAKKCQRIVEIHDGKIK